MSNDTALGAIREPQSEAAFWRVYDEAVPIVYAYLLRRTDAGIAEDLTQDVFCTAARTFRAGAPQKITVPWLMTVAKSRLIDHFRAEQRRRRNLVLAWSDRRTDLSASAEESSEAQRLAPVVEEALTRLPAPQRAALMLHYLDDLSVADVADMLGRSVRATESLLARARQSLEAGLKEGDR